MFDDKIVSIYNSKDSSSAPQKSCSFFPSLVFILPVQVYSIYVETESICIEILNQKMFSL